VKRREFITLLGSAAAAWPLAARAQQREQMRRIGVLMAFASDDPEGQARLAAVAQGLQQSGWTVGQNVRVDYRWSGGNADNMRKYAAELVGLAPDVILAHSSQAVAPLLQATRTVPIVFTGVSDPVGAGYVDSLARPGGNATGFLVWEYSIAGKWLELLKGDRAPRNAGGGPSRICHRGRTCPVRRDPSRRAVAWRGVAPGRCARCRRDRARHHGSRRVRTAA
jgi:putative tryptophan/tyrosine transport system substrate-binding protein